MIKKHCKKSNSSFRGTFSDAVGSILDFNGNYIYSKKIIEKSDSEAIFGDFKIIGDTMKNIANGVVTK